MLFQSNNNAYIGEVKIQKFGISDLKVAYENNIG